MSRRLCGTVVARLYEEHLDDFRFGTDHPVFLDSVLFVEIAFVGAVTVPTGSRNADVPDVQVERSNFAQILSQNKRILRGILCLRR